MTGHSGFVAAALFAGAISSTACSDRDKATTVTSKPADVAMPKATATSYTPDAAGVALTPSKPVTFRDGEAAYHAGNYGEATTMFTRLTEEKPGNAWGHFMLGLSASKAGDPKAAMKAFDEALRIDPKHVKSLINSARLLIDQKRPDEALPRLEQVVALEPDASAVHRLFGRTYHAQGNVEEAIAAYERAIELDAKDSWSLNNLGLLLFENGRAADAVPLLTRAVDLRKDVAIFSNNLGMALEHTGQLEDAASAYRQALAAEPSHTKAKRNLARVEGMKPAADQ